MHRVASTEQRAGPRATFVIRLDEVQSVVSRGKRRTRLGVTLADAAGTNVTSSVASAGTVTQIDMTGTTPQLIIGNMEVGLADIAAVAN